MFHRTVLFRLALMGAAVLAVAAPVQAASYQFGCIPAIGSATDCAIGSNQILMDVSSVSTHQVAFRFSNNGDQKSGIEGIYFDDGTLLGISTLIDKDEGVGGLSTVDFTAGSASPPELPRAHNLTPVFETTAGFLADSDSPTSKNAINVNEWLAVIFDLKSGGTYDDVIAELASGELRVGLHVIGFASGGSESMINNVSPVPVPASLPLLISGLLTLVRLRKRSRS